MNTRPPELADTDIAAALEAGWEIATPKVEYAALGFGSHHWVVTDDQGDRWFATVDDLRTKSWIGGDAETAFAGLRRAFAAAAALRNEGGLAFVCAPVGDPLRRLTPDYSIALFPFVTGTRHPYGEFPSDDMRDAALRLIADLHAATEVVAAESVARETFALPDRTALDIALRELETPWSGGPFAEAARELLAANSEQVRDALDAYDDFARAAQAGDEPFVLTHGEPHAANVIATDEGLVLVDWDTAMRAPRERDLARIVASVDEADAYGIAVDPDRLTLYGLWWDLAEIAGYTATFRRPHTHSADMRAAFDNLGFSVRLGEHWPGLLD